MLQFLAKWEFDPVEVAASGCQGIHPLLLLFAFWRSNFTVSYFGANIYPEVLVVKTVGHSEWVTGKFVQVKEDGTKPISICCRGVSARN